MGTGPDDDVAEKVQTQHPFISAVKRHDLNPEQKHPTPSGRNLCTLGEAVGGTGRASVEALTQVQFWDCKKDDVISIECLG